MADVPPYQAPPPDPFAPQQKKPLWPWVLAGVLGLCVLAPLLAFLQYFPHLNDLQATVQAQMCQQELKRVGDAVIACAKDHDGRFPNSLQEAEDYVNEGNPNLLNCPIAKSKEFAAGYAYNRSVFAGAVLSRLTDEQKAKPLLIEVKNVSERALTPESRWPIRHLTGRWVNAYFVGRGAVRLRPTDAQLRQPILSGPLPEQDFSGLP